MKSKFLLLVTSLLILASQVSFAEYKKVNPIVIEWYGDSTTAGLTFESGQYKRIYLTEPRIVQDMLNKKLGRGTVVIKNRGADGTTADQLINGTGNYRKNFSTQVNSGGANIVVINFGINDAYTPAHTAEKFGNELAELIRISKDAGKTTVIETPNPIDNMHNESLWAYQNQAAVTSAKLGVPIISQWGEMMKNPEWKSLLGDKIHPTRAGYSLKSEVSFSVIEPIVEAMIRK